MFTADKGVIKKRHESALTDDVLTRLLEVDIFSSVKNSQVEFVEVGAIVLC